MINAVELLRALDEPCGGLIHVGANTGQEVQSYKAAGLKNSVLIEPIPLCFEQLKLAIGEHPGMIPIQALCADVSGVEHDFFIANNGGQSSSVLPPARHLQEHPDVEFRTKARVRSNTLDEVMVHVDRVHGVGAENFNTLVIDVQGAELMVLKGASQTLRNVQYVFSEVSYGNLYQGDVVLEDLQAYLKVFDFRLFWMRMTKHGWGDALFVKRSPESLK